MKKLMMLLSAGLIFSSSAQTLKLTTYNLGLAHTFVPYAKERKSPLIESLKNHDSDILCLQEVWRKKDQKDLKKALKKRFPYSYSTKIKNHRTGPRPTCRIKEIFGEGKFVSCMQKQCGGQEGDEFTDCIINKCGGPLEALKKSNRNCASALMAQVGKSPIASILTLVNPLWRAGLFAYKGSNGLMLFSKYPLEKKRYLDLKDISTLNRRGALQARVDIAGNEIELMCTHITADLSVPYTGPFKSWGDENRAQIGKLLGAKGHTVLPTIMLGDFNCGMADSEQGISPELEKNCQIFNDYGLSDPVSTDARECTFCSDNFLNEGENSSYSIDHIFLSGLKALRTDIAFKAPITIETKKGSVKTNLSDHYGVRVEVELPVR